MPQLARRLAALTASLVLAGACTPKAADTASQPPPAQMEVDPNATKTVVPVDFGGKLPDDAEVKGELQASFGWTDRHGQNAVVIGKTSFQRGDATTETLFADHLLWEGDAWTLQRRFKEMVGGCQFDVELTALTGAWSVTDLDNDGLGEATFAWRAGCRSDVSPVKHKVLVIRYGLEQGGSTEKYVLRGDTKVDAGGGAIEGGDFKVDPSFAEVPKAYREHAVKVWGLTATETMR